MADYSSKRNKPSTQLGYQRVIDRCIVPLLGRKKVQDVKRPDVVGVMEKLAYKPIEANKVFSILRKMFNLAEVWGYRHLNPTQLHRTPSPKGNPALNSLSAIFKAMGLRLAVQPLGSPETAHAG